MKLNIHVNYNKINGLYYILIAWIMLLSYYLQYMYMHEKNLLNYCDYIYSILYKWNFFNCEKKITKKLSTIFYFDFNIGN